MKRIAPLCLAALIAAPTVADEPKRDPLLPSEEDLQELGRIAEGWLKNLSEHMAPMVNKLEALVDDLDAYEAPEMLDNGDIIIRRKPEPEPAPETPDTPEQIDL